MSLSPIRASTEEQWSFHQLSAPRTTRKKHAYALLLHVFQTSDILLVSPLQLDPHKNYPLGSKSVLVQITQFHFKFLGRFFFLKNMEKLLCMS
jgi:hypothetical protein